MFYGVKINRVEVEKTRLMEISVVCMSGGKEEKIKKTIFRNGKGLDRKSEMVYVH